MKDKRESVFIERAVEHLMCELHVQLGLREDQVLPARMVIRHALRDGMNVARKLESADRGSLVEHWDMVVVPGDHLGCGADATLAFAATPEGILRANARRVQRLAALEAGEEVIEDLDPNEPDGLLDALS